MKKTFYLGWAALEDFFSWPDQLHDPVDALWAALGRLHLVALLHVLDHVRQRDPGVGDPAERVDLPKEDAKAPHVALAREPIPAEGFGSGPLDGKLETENLILEFTR